LPASPCACKCCVAACSGPCVFDAKYLRTTFETRAIFTIGHSLRVIAAICVATARRHPQPNVCATHFSAYRPGARGHRLQAQPMQRAPGTHTTSDACGRRRGKPRCTVAQKSGSVQGTPLATAELAGATLHVAAGRRRAAGFQRPAGADRASEHMGQQRAQSLGGVKADAGNARGSVSTCVGGDERAHDRNEDERAHRSDRVQRALHACLHAVGCGDAKPARAAQQASEARRGEARRGRASQIAVGL
jgi:hypothetical protein